MKKQTKKLTLNKKTISNLNSSEMGRLIGGTVRNYGCGNRTYYNCGGTRNGNTCLGHNTCYTCVTCV